MAVERRIRGTIEGQLKKLGVSCDWDCENVSQWTKDVPKP